ncbi:hypothetical protein BV20DRAFT_982999 [Pilatotrama ljubarskyi]|nr:hypothetical protein BV20DRAFT_982999 [Pilatotrama ljubarskyi]
MKSSVFLVNALLGLRFHKPPLAALTAWVDHMRHTDLGLRRRVENNPSPMMPMMPMHDAAAPGRQKVELGKECEQLLRCRGYPGDIQPAGPVGPPRGFPEGGDIKEWTTRWRSIAGAMWQRIGVCGTRSGHVRLVAAGELRLGLRWKAGRVYACLTVSASITLCNVPFVPMRARRHFCSTTYTLSCLYVLWERSGRVRWREGRKGGDGHLLDLEQELGCMMVGTIRKMPCSSYKAKTAIPAFYENLHRMSKAV